MLFHIYLLITILGHFGTKSWNIITFLVQNYPLCTLILILFCKIFIKKYFDNFWKISQYQIFTLPSFLLLPKPILSLMKISFKNNLRFTIFFIFGRRKKNYNMAVIWNTTSLQNLKKRWLTFAFFCLLFQEIFGFRVMRGFKKKSCSFRVKTKNSERSDGTRNWISGYTQK